MILDSDHRYWNGEGDARREIPGVSFILSAMGHKSKWEVHNSDYYKTRGSFVHKATALDDAGNLRMDTVDPRVLPYLETWREFKKANHVLIHASEMMVHNEELDYAGTLDRIIEMDGRQIVLDLKCGVKCRWHQLQVAAYWLAAGRAKAGAGNLYLKDTGRWSLDVLLPIALDAAVTQWRGIVTDFHNTEGESLWAEG